MLDTLAYKLSVLYKNFYAYASARLHPFGLHNAWIFFILYVGKHADCCGGAKSKTKMARIPKQRNMQQIYKKRTWKKHSQARYLMCSVQFPAFVLQL